MEIPLALWKIILINYSLRPDATEQINAELHTFCTGTARAEVILRGNLRNALAEDQYMIEAP